MIRKFLHLESAPTVVVALFQDLEGWPAWMSGVRTVKVLDRQNDRLRVELVQLQMGQTMRQVLDCRLDPTALHLRQIEGRFRRWEAHWRFVPSPGGRGTTAEMALDFDLGPLSLVVPKRMLHDAIDQIFRRTAVSVRERLATSGDSIPLAAEIAGDTGRALLEALRRGEGVVLEVAGRRYRLVADDARPDAS